MQDFWRLPSERNESTPAMRKPSPDVQTALWSPSKTGERPEGSMKKRYSMETPLATNVWREDEIAKDDILGLENPEKANMLGSGAFGDVARVLWRKTPVAAKIAHANTMSEDEKALLLRELEVMARVRHPNIVQFLGYVDTPFVIVLELVPGGNLRQYYRSRTVSVAHKTLICLDVLRALAYLHNRRPSSIIHRDVKPANVLMTYSGFAKLTDFGLGSLMRARAGLALPAGFNPWTARISNQDHVVLSAAASGVSRTKDTGTPMYMAPEVVHTSTYDEKVDIYSSAVTFYELFEEQLFDANTRFARGLTPSRIAVLIKQMGDVDPTCRPSALELIDSFVATKHAPVGVDDQRQRAFGSQSVVGREASYGCGGSCTVS